MKREKDMIRRMMLDEMTDGWMDDPEKVAKAQAYRKMLLEDEDRRGRPTQKIRVIYTDGSSQVFSSVAEITRKCHISKETVFKYAYNCQAVFSGKNKGLRFELV